MVEYLETNPVLYMMMTESVKRGEADIFYDRPDGVGIFNRTAKAHMFAAANEDAARAMFDGIKSYSLLTMYDQFTLAEARKRYTFSYSMECLQAVYLKKSIDLIPADIRTLDLSYFDFVRAHYDGVDDPGYITGRLCAGELFGIFVDGAIAGFMGTHEEGSLGLLEILPEYRRRGLAEALERHVIAAHLARGWTPFSQIWPDNIASITLHEKLGFTFSTERLYWLY